MRGLLNRPFVQHRTFSCWKRDDYLKDYKESIESPDVYWREKAKNIDWFEFPTQITPSSENGSWFAGGKLNTSYLCLDKHVKEGRGGTTAIAFDSLVEKGKERELTYTELLNEVSKLALVFKQMGVAKGDIVLIYMPHSLEAIVAMLASARIGAPHCVVFAGFAPDQLAARINHTKAKLVVTSSFAMESYKKIELAHTFVVKALEKTNHTPKVLCLNRDGKDSIPSSFADWNEQLRKMEGEDILKAEIMNSEDPIYYLHTSGTTGAPKALTREHGGQAVALNNAATEIFGINGYGNTMFSASDVGWVVGHGWCCYGPLLRGAKTLIVEGKPIGNPDHLSWFRLLEKHKVSTIFCAPTAVRAIKNETKRMEDIQKNFNLSNLKAWFVAGEKCDVVSFHWLQKLLKTIPVYDNWWQTETSWPHTSSGFVGSYGSPPVIDGSCGIPVPGYKISLSEKKEILIKLPLPPSCSNRLLHDEGGKMFHEKYLSQYPGYYLTGDCGEINEQQNVTVTARTDDVINVSGHRLTTSQMEEAVMQLEGVTECAVVGKKDKLKGEVPVAFVVGNERLKKEDVIGMVREHVGAVAAMKEVHIVPKLPKTRSQKILRKTLREIAENAHFINIPPTIEDASVITEIEKIVLQHKT